MSHISSREASKQAIYKKLIQWHQGIKKRYEMQISCLVEFEIVMKESWFRVSRKQSEMVRNIMFRTPDCLAMKNYSVT
jgi:hypothetical protein